MRRHTQESLVERLRVAAWLFESGEAAKQRVAVEQVRLLVPFLEEELARAEAVDRVRREAERQLAQQAQGTMA